MPTPLRRDHDFAQFLKVLKREGRPTHLPFYEHVASSTFVDRRMGVEWSRMSPADSEYWKVFVDFWMSLGFDCVPLEIGLNCSLVSHEHSKESRGSESMAAIASMKDFEAYPWPDLSAPIHFAYFDDVARLLPDGVKIVGGVSGGPFEWVSQMMGVAGLSLAIFTDPELVTRMFDMIGALHHSAVRQLATHDAIGALRQGDDLGFKTATFLSPDHLRQYVFPIYKKMVGEAHANGKPFILHSCGDLSKVYDDLIDDVKIDAKHSFEDVILPVPDFKQQYRGRVTPLGGLDVDKICRSDEAELRRYARRMIESCWDDGYWAMGTGNSLTDYMPVENYIMVLEEGIKVAG